MSSSAFTEEVTYLIRTQSHTGDNLQGAAFTDSDQWEVNGYVLLEHELKSSFIGSWTRSGKIEAVDHNGDMYLFDVIRVLDDIQAIRLTNNY